MPYEIRRAGTRHCVVKEADGKVIHCFPTHAQALAQLKALYAAEADTLGRSRRSPKPRSTP